MELGMYIIIDSYYDNFQNFQMKKYNNFFSNYKRNFKKILSLLLEGWFSLLVHANSPLSAHFPKSPNPPKLRGMGAGVWYQIRVQLKCCFVSKLP